MASLYSPQIEAIQISINWRVEIPIVEYPYNKTLIVVVVVVVQSLAMFDSETL